MKVKTYLIARDPDEHFVEEILPKISLPCVGCGECCNMGKMKKYVVGIEVDGKIYYADGIKVHGVIKPGRGEVQKWNKEFLEHMKRTFNRDLKKRVITSEEFSKPQGYHTYFSKKTAEEIMEALKGKKGIVYVLPMDISEVDSRCAFLSTTRDKNAPPYCLLGKYRPGACVAYKCKVYAMWEDLSKRVKGSERIEELIRDIYAEAVKRVKLGEVMNGRTYHTRWRTFLHSFISSLYGRVGKDERVLESIPEKEREKIKEAVLGRVFGIGEYKGFKSLNVGALGKEMAKRVYALMR